MAKGIGNGFPLGAVVTTPKIAEVLLQSGHFNTYGGNPLACAAGIAVLDVIEKEGLQQNSKEVGAYFFKCLTQLRDKHEVVGDVRGQVRSDKYCFHFDIKFRLIFLCIEIRWFS